MEYCVRNRARSARDADLADSVGAKRRVFIGNVCVDLRKPYRSAGRRTELISLQSIVTLLSIHHRSEEWLRIQRFVSHKFKSATVDLVCTRLGDRIHYPAGLPTELRAEIVGLHRKLLQCIRIGHWIR